MGRFRQCYHHCTLLIESDLDFLNNVLLSKIENAISVWRKENYFNSQTKATNSVRSVVTNIKDIYPTAQKQTILKAVEEQFLVTYNTDNPTIEVDHY